MYIYTTPMYWPRTAGQLYLEFQIQLGPGLAQVGSPLGRPFWDPIWEAVAVLGGGGLSNPNARRLAPIRSDLDRMGLRKSLGAISDGLRKFLKHFGSIRPPRSVSMGSKWGPKGVRVPVWTSFGPHGNRLGVSDRSKMFQKFL